MPTSSPFRSRSSSATWSALYAISTESSGRARGGGYVFDADSVEGREYHGQPTNWSCRLVLNDRRPQFELVAPLAGPNICADWLDARGEGLHHIAYVVASVSETTAQMTAAGHAVIQSGHSFGADRDGVFAYYDTTEALGFVIDAVEPPGGLPEPAFRL